MKKFLLTMVVLSAVICALTTGAVAFAESEATYTLLMPVAKNYLYLTSPTVVAIDGQTVAVYDSFDNKVYLAGNTLSTIDLTLEDKDDYITQMVLKGSDLFILTCFSSLYHYDTTSSVLTKTSYVDTPCSLFADTENLYIYDGLKSVYKLNLASKQIEQFTDLKNRILNTKNIAVIDNVAYCLKWNGDVYRFNLSTLETSFFVETSAQYLDTITQENENMLLAYENQQTPLLSLYKTDGSLLQQKSVADVFKTSGSLEALSSDGNTLATIVSASKSVLTANSLLELSSTIYGCSSELEGWFNTPSDMAAFGTGGTDGMLILDKGNNRIAKIFLDNEGNVGQTQYLNYAFDGVFALAYGNYTTYIANKNTIYRRLSSSAEWEAIPTDYEIKSISANDQGLFVLDGKSNMVYQLPHTSSTFEMVAKISADATKIKVAEGNYSPVYALDSKGISVFTSVGKQSAEIVFSDCQLSDVTDFCVDAIGNVIVSSSLNNSAILTKFSRNLKSFVKQDSYTYKNTSYSVSSFSAISLNLNRYKNNLFAVSSQKNMLLKIDNSSDLSPVSFGDIPASDALTETQLKEISYSSVGFATAMNCPVYQSTNNFNSVISNLVSGTKVLTFAQFSTSDLIYVLTEDGRQGYVETSKISSASVPSVTPLTIRALHDDVKVYAYPSPTASSSTISKSSVMTIINNSFDFDNGYNWYGVQYLEGGIVKFGYVMRTRVVEYLPENEISDPVYKKVKASRIGAKVTVYSLADEKSASVTTLKDGTKVQLLEEFDTTKTFTLVRIDENTFGYILTEDIQTQSGLTNGQLIAIILTSSMIIITSIYLILSRRTKKQII